MKKFLSSMLIALVCIQAVPMAYAASVANIRIKVTGALKDNRYFLCLPNVGCLSILAGEKGKVFPVFQPVQMSNIFVTNVTDFSVFAQGLPDSCNVTVDDKKTLTISGHITTGPQNSVVINQLRCSVN